MRTFPPLAFLFAFQQQQQQQQQHTTSTNVLRSSRIPLFLSSKQIISSVQDRNFKIQELLTEATKVGQVGSIASEEERARMISLAEALVQDSDPHPARYPLQGVHTLVYSAAPGGSSGQLFGNVIGKVSQLFEDEDIFYNRVQLGPLLISLKARREVKNDTSIKVTFLETTVSLFGKALVQKELKGGGVWRCLFVGKMQDANGKEKLVRVMETPSLFVIEQTL
jgi:hypothetical protein